MEESYVHNGIFIIYIYILGGLYNKEYINKVNVYKIRLTFTAFPFFHPSTIVMYDDVLRSTLIIKTLYDYA